MPARTLTSSTTTAYAPLWCKSHYSFREGASAPDELVRRAGELGLPALALTDRDGVPGAPKAHVAVREWAGDTPPPRLILGSQVTVESMSGHDSTITLLVQDRRGYAHLCNLVTTGRLRCGSVGEQIADIVPRLGVERGIGTRRA